METAVDKTSDNIDYTVFDRQTAPFVRHVELLVSSTADGPIRNLV